MVPGRLGPVDQRIGQFRAGVAMAAVWPGGLACCGIACRAAIFLFQFLDMKAAPSSLTTALLRSGSCQSPSNCLICFDTEAQCLRASFEQIAGYAVAARLQAIASRACAGRWREGLMLRNWRIDAWGQLAAFAASADIHTRVSGFFLRGPTLEQAMHWTHADTAQLPLLRLPASG